MSLLVAAPERTTRNNFVAVAINEKAPPGTNRERNLIRRRPYIVR
jgi:hypothetical protein